MLLLKILLCILKIIGIVLLVVVGIVLLILCLLLFVPIRYRVHASFYGKPRVSAHVTYLLRLLHVNFELDGQESELKIKLFGHNISDGKKTDDKETTDSHRQDNSTVKEEHDAVKAGETVKSCEVVKNDVAVKTNGAVKDDGLTKTGEAAKTGEASNGGEADELSKSEKVNEAEMFCKTDTFTKSKKTIEAEASSGHKERKESGSSHAEKSQKADKPKNSGKPESLPDKKSDKKTEVSGSDSDGIIDKVKSIVSLIKENRGVIDFVMRQLKLLFKHIMPGSHTISIKLGLDDPALLGEIVGGIAVFRAMTGIVINITPVWDDKIFEAELDFKGRIILGRVLYIAARVYFNKEVKKIIKTIKNSK